MPPLVQIMVWCLFGTKPLSDPMLLIVHQTYFSKIWNENAIISSSKWRPFCPSLNVLRTNPGHFIACQPAALCTQSVSRGIPLLQCNKLTPRAKKLSLPDHTTANNLSNPKEWIINICAISSFLYCIRNCFFFKKIQEKFIYLSLIKSWHWARGNT